MRIEESIIVERRPEDVFAFLAVRSNDRVWMRSVVGSEWLDEDAPLAVGRRGKMVMKILGRRSEYVDEVTAFEPGRRIAHRTIEGPLRLDTACVTEPVREGTRVTVLAKTPGVGGPVAPVANLVARIMMRHRFRADLARLKQVLEAGSGVVA